MNSLRSRPSFRLHSAPTSRAQLSPLARSSGLTGFATRALAPRSLPAWPLARALELAQANRADRWWDPQLLDRLEAPLTRYHD